MTFVTQIFVHIVISALCTLVLCESGVCRQKYETMLLGPVASYINMSLHEHCAIRSSPIPFPTKSIDFTFFRFTQLAQIMLMLRQGSLPH